MSSEAAMAEIIERAFEALGLGKDLPPGDLPSDDLAECIQAVRAQWAAEVERLERERDAAIEDAVGWQAQMDRDLEKLLQVAAERDSAQAEAKTLRGALETAVAALADGLWDYGPGQDEHDKCEEVLAFCRAALQPGASHDE